jgi:uncharacterized delta-60 repeat protein
MKTICIQVFILLIALRVTAQPAFLDNAFGDGGKVITAIGNNDRGYAVALQPDGKIITAGTSVIGSFRINIILARYHADGTLDNSFGNGGKVISQFGDMSVARAIALQSDGKILVAGQVEDFFGMVRYNQNGSLDTAFGNRGIAAAPFGSTIHEANAIAIQPDGKIVLAGVAPSSISGAFAAARFLQNGTLDPSFGNGGKRTISFGGGQDICNALMLQPDGKIILSGFSTIQANADFAAVRLDTNGNLDLSFNQTGTRRTAVGPMMDYASAAILLESGKILQFGYTFIEVGGTFRSGLAAVRLNGDGTIDSTFGDNGKKFLSGFLTGQDAYVYSALQEPNGKILLGGSFTGNVGLDMFVMRIDSNGVLDNSFGNNGIITADFSASEFGYGLARQPDGKILQVGNNSTRVITIRYNPQLLSTPRTPEKPVRFSLLQNYPNPFNPTTVIGYELGAASEVKLELFDVLGRKVAALVNARQNAGVHSVNVNAAQYGLTTGTYFYRLQAGGYSETKKMMLVK